jgi:hypothetical protein
MINILLLFITVIIIIIIFHIINKNLVEKFRDFDAAHPNDSRTGWTTSSRSDYDFSNYCRPGDLCNTQDGWGVYNNNCECIIPGVENKLDSEDYTDELEQQQEEETSGSHNGPLSNLQGCIRNNTNFNDYCKSMDQSYGVKSISRCDSTHSKVECGANYLNGIYYGDTSIMTPCLNKNDDFDTWCKFYNNKAVPDGFNINSIGAEKILVGEKGDCFVNDGTPDNKKARAVCNYNNIDSVKKLERTNKLIDYNTFTSCLPAKNTNFVSECARLLDEKIYEKTPNKTTSRTRSTINTTKNISSDNCKLLCDSNANCYGFVYNKNNGDCILKNSNILRESTQSNPNFDLYINDKGKDSRAVEIMGYDCNPGFNRAKCVKSNDLLFLNNNYLYKSIYDTPSDPSNNYLTCNTTCN